jgi:dynein heavy chain
MYMYLFIIPKGAEAVEIKSDVPPIDSIKKKVLLIMRSREKKDIPGGGKLTKENIADEIIFKEITKDILNNLFYVCNEVYMPVLGNPHNMIGWSDLVSKDLMDKFHVFLAHTYVTIGQVKGRTLLPLPANDVTSSEKTSSKDKA